MSDIRCPSCGSEDVKTALETEEFDWGCPVETKIKAVVPVRTCDECGFQFTDWEAEEIRDQAVANYLYGKQTKTGDNS
jgi:C4-type Zn-finger protein